MSQVVLDLAERQQSLAQFLDRLEVAHPQQVFLERPDEPFSAAVTLGRADEAGELSMPRKPISFWK